ncbi:MAG TPA: O-antigen ligase family protein [Ktedonobacteraceae bacterium]
MNSPGVGKYVSAHNDSWLDKPLHTWRTFVTSSNLTAWVCIAIAIFLLLAPPMPWNIRLTLYAALLVWTILRPRVALYLIPICVPWGSLDFIELQGLRLNSADILVIFLAIGWLMSFGLHQNAGPRDREASHIPSYLVMALLALVGTMVLSATVALNVSSSLKEISKWLEVVVVILLGSQYLRSRRQIWIIVALICLAGISQAFYGYFQAFFNLGPQSFIRDASLRVYGTFDQPNPYAGYINIPLSITLALTLLGRNWVTRILAGLTAIILGVAEYLSQSRGGEIALAAALIFIVLAGMPRIRVLTRALIVLFLGIFAALLAGWIPISAFNPLLRFLGAAQISFTNPSSQDYSTAERLAHWIAGLHMFMDHPVLGVGIGNYPDAYSRYFITIFTASLGHAHNYYINIAAETGSIGLIAFLLFLLAVFVAGGHSLREINKKLRLAKTQLPQTRTVIQAPVGRQNKLHLLLHPLSLIQYFREQDQFAIVGKLTNDRALAIGLLAALTAICAHNLVDDLFVHSLTNLIALLLIALIRLEWVTPDISD